MAVCNGTPFTVEKIWPWAGIEGAPCASEKGLYNYCEQRWHRSAVTSEQSHKRILYICINKVSRQSYKMNRESAYIVGVCRLNWDCFLYMQQGTIQSCWTSILAGMCTCAKPCIAYFFFFFNFGRLMNDSWGIRFAKNMSQQNEKTILYRSV